jgi:predicted TIM-barrel fold metal-dependent hydrolase
MQNIFDFHTHAYPEEIATKAVEFLNDYYHVTCEGLGTIEDLKQSAKEMGVNYLLVHSVATKPTQVENINSWIASHTSENILGFGTIHPLYEHIEEEMDRITELGLRGLKLHPDFQSFYIDDPMMDIVYEKAEGNLPILFHVGDLNSDFSSPRRLARVIEKYPRLTVIAAHLGGYSVWDDGIKYLAGKNVYIDTSSSLWFLKPEAALNIIHTFGIHRVLFGTDYPLMRHRTELKAFNSIGLTEAEKALILFENAKELLKL